MEAFLNSFFLVFISEIGDKTQLLSLVLMARFKKPWTILTGIFIATIVNHGIAAWLGGLAASFVDPHYLRWILALTFFGFAIWLLFPDKEEDLKMQSTQSILATTIVAFFLAEMGDKTQLATVAIGARYTNSIDVVIGSTAGLIASNAMAIFLGIKFLNKISMSWIRRSACLLFAIFGFLILFN